MSKILVVPEEARKKSAAQLEGNRGEGAWQIVRIYQKHMLIKLMLYTEIN